MGLSGLRVSELGLGTATWGTTTSATNAGTMLRDFVDAGGNLVDSSPVYAEGQAQETLAAALSDSGVRREELVLSSSAGVAPQSPVGRRVDCSRRALISQLDATLSALGTDHLDLWSVGYFDEKTPPAEVSDTLDWAIRTGRTRYAGVRDYTGWQLAVTAGEMSRFSARGIVATQHEYSLLVRGIEEEMIPAARHLGVGVIAAAPLAQGLLTGRFRDGVPRTARAEVHPLLGLKSHTVVEAVTTAAAGLDLPPAVVALAWVRDRPGVTSAVAGASNPEQLRQLLRATEAVLPRAIAQALDDVSR
ncbi:aldo/keto reductase [Corynebacterium alimapuense]|uniref:Aldo/keto reductase n=1 Tax=Corynebacterium alimapuense TaxID=1576874 RepID=A0A3M8K8F9_9CORY|nr:aldo/keto reductase [Corynebacterium alimapuense]RNE49159.1 aldo/keto reductase [Corynebacterium alimapuense]